MDWLKNLNLHLSLSSILGGFSFLANSIIAAQGGIDSPALHSLMASASGAQLVILIIITLLVKAKG